IGMVTLLSGVLLARYAPGRIAKQRYADVELGDPGSQRLALIDRLARLYLWIGGGIYFAVWPIISAIPSATAIGSPLGSLIIVGACLRLWVAQRQRRSLKFWSTVALLPLLPLATVIHGGFIGFGTYWALAVMAFFFIQSRRKVF